MRNFFIIFIASTSSLLWGNPTGPHVISGEAKIDGIECLRIEAADRTIIHWKDFSIDPGECVQFIQPSSEAAVLNRVIDASPSRLLGQMRANGRVVLVNPNGILVGKEGQIDAASFVASTLDVHHQNFLQTGELACREISWGMVVNDGEIRGTEVILMGFEVQNNGSIQGENIDLIGAKQVWLKGSPFDIRTKCTKEESQQLREMLETEGNLYAAAFKHPEDLDWPELRILKGTEAMNMPGPTAVVKGTVSGHEIKVLGDYVDVQKGSLIDASGENGGGTILLGGEYQGKSDSIKNARMTKVEGTVQADAIANGNGGKVILWGDGATGHYGHISAKGGLEGGDGGFVEISSPGYFVFQGTVATGAEKGKTGTLLLDPNGITISAAASNPAFPPGSTFFNGGAVVAAILNNVDLQNALNFPNNVLVQINNAVVGGTGNITVNAPVNWAANTTLALDTTGTGTGSIIINDVISNSGAGNVILTADGDINIAAPSGIIDMNPGTSGSISAISKRDIIINGDVPSVQVKTGKILLQADRNLTILESVRARGTDAAPATPQIIIRADANQDTVGLLQIGSPTQTNNIAVDTRAGAILVEGYNLTLGDPFAPFSNIIEAGSTGATTLGDLVVNVRNDLQMLGGSGNHAQAIMQVDNGNTTISVHHNASLLAGTGFDSDASVISERDVNGFLVFAVGNDLLMRTGTADTTDALILGFFNGTTCDLSILVGRDFIAQQNVGNTNSAIDISAANNVMVRVGRDFSLQGAFDPTSFSRTLCFLSGIDSIFCGGNIAFINEINAPIFNFLIFNDDSIDLRAGGDITIGSPIDKSGSNGYIRMESDASFANLWTAVPPLNTVSVGTGNAAILAGTPLGTPLSISSNQRGGVILATNGLGTATWKTASGDITVLSRDKTTSGSAADFTIGNSNNNAKFSTTSGDIEVNGFRNIFSHSTVITTGNIFFRAMNNMTITPAITGNIVTLVVDEQGANGHIGGIWSSGGAFSLSAGDPITANELRIFTARQNLNSILGTLNGLTFVPGPLYVDTDTEHWCVFFGGPGSAFVGPDYTVFYKDCLQQATSQAQTIVSEFLVDLHPYNEFPGWMEEFFVGYESNTDDYCLFLKEPFMLRRRHLNLLNQPKSWTVWFE